MVRGLAHFIYVSCKDIKKIPSVKIVFMKDHGADLQ